MQTSIFVFNSVYVTSKFPRRHSKLMERTRSASASFMKALHDVTTDRTITLVSPWGSVEFPIHLTEDLSMYYAIHLISVHDFGNRWVENETADLFSQETVSEFGHRVHLKALHNRTVYRDPAYSNNDKLSIQTASARITTATSSSTRLFHAVSRATPKKFCFELFRDLGID